MSILDHFQEDFDMGDLPECADVQDDYSSQAPTHLKACDLDQVCQVYLNAHGKTVRSAINDVFAMALTEKTVP